MAIFRALDRLVRWLTSAAIAVSSVLIIVVALFITADVLSAVLFNSPIPVVTEMASVTLAVIIFAALAYTQYRQQNVKVDLILAVLPAGARRVLDGFSLLVGLALFVLLAWRSIALAMTSWDTLETAMALIAFPVYPFKIGMAIGAVIGVAEYARQFAWLLLGVDELIEHAPELPPAAKI